MDNWTTELSAIDTIIFVLVVLYRAAKYKRAMRGGVMAVAGLGSSDPRPNQPNVAILQPGARPRCGDASCTAAVSGMDLWNNWNST